MEKIVQPEIINLQNCKIGILSLKTDIAGLIQSFQFTEQEAIEFQEIKHENRKKEFLAVRIILRHITGKTCEIIYNENGKPKIKNIPHCISISHSSDFAAVIISKSNTGIDIENIFRNTEIAASRFLSENEKADIDNSSNPKLQQLIYWCAKEAAFKFSKNSGIEFKSQIKINPFKVNTEGGSFSGLISKEQKFTGLKFNYLFRENNAIVYCVEDLKL